MSSVVVNYSRWSRGPKKDEESSRLKNTHHISKICWTSERSKQRLTENIWISSFVLKVYTIYDVVRSKNWADVIDFCWVHLSGCTTFNVYMKGIDKLHWIGQFVYKEYMFSRYIRWYNDFGHCNLCYVTFADFKLFAIFVATRTIAFVIFSWEIQKSLMKFCKRHLFSSPLFGLMKRDYMPYKKEKWQKHIFEFSQPLADLGYSCKKLSG